VRDLELGLSELRQVRPVRFRYNGRGGTTAGQAGVGVIGQEIETVLPETIQRISVADDPGLDDMRVFDPSALTYALINAVKELAGRVEQLEQALAAATAPASPAPVVA
jgi:endosialidase-like protein